VTALPQLGGKERDGRTGTITGRGEISEREWGEEVITRNTSQRVKGEEGSNGDVGVNSWGFVILGSSAAL